MTGGPPVTTTSVVTHEGTVLGPFTTEGLAGMWEVTDPAGTNELADSYEGAVARARGWSVRPGYGVAVWPTGTGTYALRDVRRVRVPVRVTIDGRAVFNAWHDPRDLWNGWLCPVFDRDEAARLAEWIAGYSTDGTTAVWEGDVLVVTEGQWAEEPGYVPERYGPGTYPIGTYLWTWYEAEPD